MAVKTYDPNLFVIIFDGIQIEGYAPDTFISIEAESPIWTDEAGATGEVARSKSNDNRATVTVTLMKSSSSNAILDRARQRDQESNNGVASFLAKDLASSSEFRGREAWISEQPSIEYGAELGTIEWTLRVANLQRNVQGISSTVLP